MPSSNPPASALALVLALLAVAGCAHAGASARPAPTATPARSGAPARAGAATQPGAAARLDPSEEITASELASIPEPVPLAERRLPANSAGPASNDSIQPPNAGDKAPPGAAEPRSSSSGAATPAPPSNATQAGGWTWRVQILATPDRALAERVAKQAEERLGTTFRLDVESGLFKVRLGGFASEGDAQILRQRAIEMGYPGAFRVKIRVAGPDE